MVLILILKETLNSAKNELDYKLNLRKKKLSSSCLRALGVNEGKDSEMNYGMKSSKRKKNFLFSPGNLTG